MPPSSGKPAPGSWNPLAAVGAWLLPGWGHYLLGEKRRAVILAVSIGSLWLSGLLIGGVNVCSREDHPAWFMGQMLVAPSWIVDRYQDHLKTRNLTHEPSQAEFGLSFEPSFSYASEQGILYTALAGLLNLLATIDVLYREPPKARKHSPPSTDSLT